MANASSSSRGSASASASKSHFVALACAALFAVAAIGVGATALASNSFRSFLKDRTKPARDHRESKDTSNAQPQDVKPINATDSEAEISSAKPRKDFPSSILASPHSVAAPQANSDAQPESPAIHKPAKTILTAKSPLRDVKKQSKPNSPIQAATSTETEAEAKAAHRSNAAAAAAAAIEPTHRMNGTATATKQSLHHLDAAAAKAKAAAKPSARRLSASCSTPSLVSSATCSATGKVLISGGYLIIEPEHSGLVISVSAAIKTAVAKLPEALQPRLSQATPQAKNEDEVRIAVYAPQKQSEVTHYSFNTSSHQICALSSDESLANPFLATTLHYTLQFIFAVLPSLAESRHQDSLLLCVQGDAAFYTGSAQGGKTGLGSSAALVSSIVGALFNHFGLIRSHEENADLTPKTIDLHLPSLAAPLSFDSDLMIELAHNLAQVCHCVSQGKVGSGFDVSSAFYGSHRYKRFAKECIESVVNSKEAVSDETLVAAVLPAEIGDQIIGTSQSSASSSRRMSKRLSGAHSSVTLSPPISAEDPLNHASIEPPTHDESELKRLLRFRPSDAWQQTCEPFSLPKGWTLMLGDVNAGTSTTDMVKRVFAWKKSDSTQAATLWSDLALASRQFEQFFVNLIGQLSGEASLPIYESTVEAICTLDVSQWGWLLSANSSSGIDSTLVQELSDCRSAYLSVRAAYRAVGEAAQVQIEPVELQKVCDEVMSCKGVLLSGCPGAGGNDAVFAIALNAEAVKSVQQVWVQSGIKRLPVQQQSSAQTSSRPGPGLQLRQETLQLGDMPIWT